jgi:hypothetical protein
MKCHHHITIMNQPPSAQIRRSKRRRINRHDSADDAIDLLIPSRTESPIALSAGPLQSTELASTSPSSEEEEESGSQSQPLLTQPPDFIHSPPSAPSARQRIQYAAAPSISATPLNEISGARQSCISSCAIQMYNKNPRPFQLEAIHHLAFHDDSQLVLIRRTADGKSLVPLVRPMYPVLL